MRLTSLPSRAVALRDLTSQLRENFAFNANTGFALNAKFSLMFILCSYALCLYYAKNAEPCGREEAVYR